MAKVNLVTIFLITTLLIATLLLLGAGCQEQQAPQQPGGQQQQGGQQQPPQGQMTTLFSDDFSAYSGIASGVTPTGWTPVTKEGLYASVKGTTQGNKVYGLVLELKGRFVKTGQSNWKDYILNLEFKLNNAGDHVGPEVIFRLQDDDNYYVLTTESRPTGTTYSLNKVSGNATTELKRRATTTRIDTDAWHNMQLSIQGNDLAVTVDNESVLTATTDGAFTTGLIGFGTNPYSDIFLDNIVVIGTTA